jgi:general stress protein 26
MSSNDKNNIIKIMKANANHAYLATCDGDQPVIRSMSPIIENDMTIWMSTFKSSRKMKQIRKNPKICLWFVEQPSGDKSVSVIGKVQIIENIKEKTRVWNLAGYDLSAYFPDGPSSSEFCLLKIKVTKIEWRDSWTAPLKTFKP